MTITISNIRRAMGIKKLEDLVILPNELRTLAVTSENIKSIAARIDELFQCKYDRNHDVPDSKYIDEYRYDSEKRAWHLPEREQDLKYGGIYLSAKKIPSGKSISKVAADLEGFRIDWLQSYGTLLSLNQNPWVSFLKDKTNPSKDRGVYLSGIVHGSPDYYAGKPAAYVIDKIGPRKRDAPFMAGSFEIFRVLRG